MANFEFRAEPEQESEALVYFIGEVQNLLGELLAEHRFLFVEPLLPELDGLLETSNQYFQQASNWCEVIPNDYLLEHDLLAPNLNRKLSQADYWNTEFQRTVSEYRQGTAPQRPGWIPQRVLRRLLEYLNSMLKSIIGSAPGGSAIVEIKEAFESAVDDLSEN